MHDRRKCWLVTGGGGFIGSHFIRASLAEDPALIIVNLDAQTYAACPLTLADLDPGRHRLVVGDINDGALVAELLESWQPEAVVHLAAESHVDRSIDTPRPFIHTNINGTGELLDRTLAWWRRQNPPLRDRFRFLHVSTDEVYGSLDHGGRFSEDSPYRPNSPYAASKAAADHLVRAWHRTYGLPAIISNCSNNYGSHQYPEKLIPLMTLKAAAGEQLPVYGDGAQVRDWLHVGDHVRALKLIIEQGQVGRVYNIGGDNERRNLELVESICAIVDELEPGAGPRREQIRFVSDRPGHDRRYAIDFTRLRRELGWRPGIDFDAGLRDTVRWYLEHPDWVEAARQAYQGQRLGVINA